MGIVTHSPATEQAMPQGISPDLSLALAEALATMLCHDLAGAVGTLQGALELAAEDPAMLDEALPVAQEAATALSRRLRFMRAAWGAGGRRINVAELHELAGCLPTGRRVRVQLEALSPDRSFSPPATQLLLNLLKLGVESLAGEGVLSMGEAQGGEVMITLSGPRAAWPSGFAAFLTDSSAALRAAITQGPRQLQAPLAALIAHAGQLRVRLLLGAQTEAAPPLLVDLG